MSKPRIQIEGHICQGGKYPGTIRKYPFILCSLCMKDGVDVVRSEREIDDYNKKVWAEDGRKNTKKPAGFRLS